MEAPITDQEVRNAIWSIEVNKSPGPDGYSAWFYKKAWPIVGEEVTVAVQEVFVNRKLLRQVNATALVLIPKKDNPTNMREYRPLACCNVLYKGISKILTD